MEPQKWRFGSDDFPFQLDDFQVHFRGCGGISNRFPDSITAKTEPSIYSPSILPSGRSILPDGRLQKLDDEYTIRNIYEKLGVQECAKNGSEFTIGICDRCTHDCTDGNLLIS